MVDVIYEHDGVVDHDPGQHNQADEDHDAQGDVEGPKHNHHTDQGQRDGEHDHERMEQRLELGRHHHIDEEDRQSQGEGQAVYGGLHFPALPRNIECEIGGHFDVLEHALDVARDALQIPAADVGGNQRGPLLVNAPDLAGSLAQANVRHRGKWNGDTRSGIDDQAFEIVDGGLVLLPDADEDVYLALPVPELRGHAALHLVSDQHRHVAEVQAVIGQTLPVIHDLDLGMSPLNVGLHVVKPRNPSQFGLGFPAQ